MALEAGEKDQTEANEAIDRFKEHPDTIDKLDAYREEQADKAKRAAKNLKRSQRAFATFTKGMGLKLSKAELTATFADDIAVLDELERAIRRQIQREGKTFDLVSQLFAVHKAKSSLVSDRATASQDVAEDAWQQTLDALDLGLDRAVATPASRTTCARSRRSRAPSSAASPPRGER